MSPRDVRQGGRLLLLFSLLFTASRDIHQQEHKQFTQFSNCSMEIVPGMSAASCLDHYTRPYSNDLPDSYIITAMSDPRCAGIHLTRTFRIGDSEPS